MCPAPPLSDSATWNNTALSGPGLTLGTYTWAGGSVGSADSFVINITAARAPDPSSLALLTTAVLCLRTARRLTRRSNRGATR